MGVELKAATWRKVSINLTDFEQTPMHRVYEMVKREAERYGVMPVGSENRRTGAKKSDRDGGRTFPATGELLSRPGV